MSVNVDSIMMRDMYVQRILGLPDLEQQILSKLSTVSSVTLRELQPRLFEMKKKLEEHRVQVGEDAQEHIAKFRLAGDLEQAKEVDEAWHAFAKFNDKTVNYFDTGIEISKHQIQVNEEIRTLNTGSLFAIDDLSMIEEERRNPQEMSTSTKQINERHAQHRTQEQDGRKAEQLIQSKINRFLGL